MLSGPCHAWFARQVTAAGALIVPGAPVRHLLRDGRGQVIGVRVNRSEGELLSDLVILADGANALLGERMEIYPRRRAEQLLLTARELLTPPAIRGDCARWIEQRCALEPGLGMAIEIFGALTPALNGKALLYTNTDSFAFSVSGGSPSCWPTRSTHAFVQAVKSHPAIAPLLADCGPARTARISRPRAGSPRFAAAARSRRAVGR